MVLALPESEKKYTRSEERILEFIEEFTDEFLFMSIGQLAQRLEISEATISRFARHTGYRDFKELKNGVAQQNQERARQERWRGLCLKRMGLMWKTGFPTSRSASPGR